MPAAVAELKVGDINPKSVYTKHEIMIIMKWSQRAWKLARRKGLRVHMFARRMYVRGSELLRFLTSLDENGEPIEER